MKAATVVNQPVPTVSTDKSEPKSAPTVTSQPVTKPMETIKPTQSSTAKPVGIDAKPTGKTQSAVFQPELKNAEANSQPVNTKQPAKSTVSPTANQTANDKGATIVDGKVVPNQSTVVKNNTGSNPNQPVKTPVQKAESNVSKVNPGDKNQLPVIQPASPKTEPETKQTTTSVSSASANQENNYLYTIQLDVQNTYVDPTYYKKKYNLKEDVFFMERKGEFVYYAGNYNTIDDAKAAITRYGLMGYIVTVDRTLLKKSK